jgi:arsenate reductase
MAIYRRLAMITIYGIKNCSTMKKAFAWCDEHGVEYAFHDYKKEGVPRERLRHWCQELGWQALVNSRGTTWRKLSAAQQAISTQDQAVILMQEFPSLIKRPVVEATNKILVGFDPQQFESLLKAGKR